MKNKIFNLHLFSTILVASLGGVLGQHYSSNIRCFERERQALLKFKDELVDEYGRLSSWGLGKNKRECCEWRGVHCHNRSNHITQLNLRAPQDPVSYPLGIVHVPSVAPLKGKISSSLFELKHLTYLDLSYNDFGYSNFLEFICSLEKLQYLNLSAVDLSGQIPQSIGNLSKLIYLDFSWNNALYSDNLDWVSHLDSLKYLDLSEVSLRNASNWLQAISKLTSIKELHLRYCILQEIHPSSLPFINSSAPLAILDLSLNYYISSSMFQWFLNFSKSLTFIDLLGLGNDATCLISTYSFDDQIFLAHLELSYNNLECGIPKSFGNMSSLTYLSLQGTHLTAPLSELMMNLSGPLEKKLRYLSLSDNMISGSLPNFSRFSLLNHLDLGGNKLNASIANGFLNIPHLIHLDLSSNNFTGAIPDLTTHPFLKRLYLNNNMFNGYLRESIGRLSMMEHLVLGSNNLEGIITESHFSNLSRLKILDFSSNSLLTVNCSPHWVPPFQLKFIILSGCKIGQRFPQWFQFQRKLEFLDISSSQIADIVPHWFGKLASRPMYLNASNNDIHGILPESLFSWSLKDASVGAIQLDLSRNKIRGQVTFLCNNKVWELIDLSDNLFFGHLPNCFTNSTWLTFLSLANNHFIGEIPNSIGSLESLCSLNLRNNSLSGGIPTSLRNCKRLELIELGENMLTGNIPTWIGDSLSRLIVLSLISNELDGAIPWSICSLQKIQVLDLSSNMISGPIPNCLYNLSAMTKEAVAYMQSFGYSVSYQGHYVNKMYYSLRDGAYITWKGKEIKYVKGLLFVKLIDLSDNLLVGDIPSKITKLDGLVTLNLSRNHLCGQIPQNIGDLKDLNALDLSRNLLSGSIPISISELTIGVLDLSYNNLSGRIPPRYTSFDESAYAGNSGLCGRLILNKSCPGENEINPQDPNFNNDNNVMNNWEHEDDKLITKGFYICMVFGFVIGFWGIFGTILLSN